MIGPMRAIFESFNDFRIFFGYIRAVGRTAEPRSSTFEENIERDRSARPTVTDVVRRHRTVRSPSTHATAAAGLSADAARKSFHSVLISRQTTVTMKVRGGASRPTFYSARAVFIVLS